MIETLCSVRSILVIDDDAVTLGLFEGILRANGYSVRGAADAELGLRELAHDVPAAILVDLRLPIVDGVEFLRRLRTRPGLRRVPVAIVTGDYFVNDYVVRELEMLGASIYFKPLFEDDLVAVVECLLKRARDSEDGFPAGG
jgi:two-component system, OmpR family, response regulator QseB